VTPENSNSGNVNSGNVNSGNVNSGNVNSGNVNSGKHDVSTLHIIRWTYEHLID